MDWRPTLNDREGPLYRRIVDALTADVASGRLRRGPQLPTHRALAKALSVDLTTVTRAYTEAPPDAVPGALAGGPPLRRDGSTDGARHICRREHVAPCPCPAPGPRLFHEPPAAADGGRPGRPAHPGHCGDPTRGRVLRPSQLSRPRRKRGRTRHRSRMAAFADRRGTW